jgi:hypothetical protein
MASAKTATGSMNFDHRTGFGQKRIRMILVTPPFPFGKDGGKVLPE